jgi:protein SCO1
MNSCARSWRPMVAAACLAGGLLLLPGGGLAHDAKEHAPVWPGTNDYRRSVRTYAIPDVVLTDADAQPVRLRELLATNDPVMLNFVFTTCGTICPVMIRVFADVPATLGAQAKNLRMISISIDPDNDTPTQLKAYAKNVGAGERWKFLTGRVQDIKTVQLAFDSYRGDKMNHEPLTLMRHAPGKPWVRIDGFANPGELVHEYRKAVPQ